jgi:hypothetical protein
LSESCVFIIGRVRRASDIPWKEEEPDPSAMAS